MSIARRWFLTCAAAALVAMLGLPMNDSLAEPGGGPQASDIELVKEFDKNKDGWLDAKERAAAKVKLLALQKERAAARKGRGPRGRRGSSFPPGTPGPSVTPKDVKVHLRGDLYEPGLLRTVFLQFEGDNWEEELATFKPTDVEIPATLTIDGKAYPGVGASFRGASSFFRIPSGSKRSLNLSMDLADRKQRLHGVKTLNLLNCMGDASMMSSLLYSHIARQRIAAPKVNFVKVVINGKSWGIYANVQQYNKDFLAENYDTRKGARWKASGSPRGDAGLRYLGDEIAPYRERFEIKSKDKESSWQALIALCKALDTTAPKDVPKTLAPLLDLDSVLWFLAVDVALVNSDGYWARASDFNLYRHKDGIFHVIPHDMNEAFYERSSRRRGGGPPNRGPRGEGPPPPGPRGEGPPRGGPPEGGRPEGGPPRDRQPRGGPPGRGRGPSPTAELDPLVGLDNARFPLRKKLLANPILRTRYLQYVRLIASKYLDWNYLGPLVARARTLIEAEVKADTRKLTTFEAFQKATDDTKGSFRNFCERRAAYLLGLDVIKQLPEKLVELPKHK